MSVLQVQQVSLLRRHAPAISGSGSCDRAGTRRESTAGIALRSRGKHFPRLRLLLFLHFLVVFTDGTLFLVLIAVVAAYFAFLCQTGKLDHRSLAVLAVTRLIRHCTASGADIHACFRHLQGANGTLARFICPHFAHQADILGDVVVRLGLGAFLCLCCDIQQQAP